MKKSELKNLIKEILSEEMVKPSEEQIEFSKEISDRMKVIIRTKGNIGYNEIEALRQIISHKLSKEGWISEKEFNRQSDEQLPPENKSSGLRGDPQ